jgi:hypothetical protein
MAVDLFVFNLKWASRFGMFPIDYKDFKEKYWDFLLYHHGGSVALEKLLFSKFIKATFNEEHENVALTHLAYSKLHILKDREPVHTGKDENGFQERKMYWPEMGLVTYHDPESKKEIVNSLQQAKGEVLLKLRRSTDLSYFNNGVRRTTAKASK